MRVLESLITQNIGIWSSAIKAKPLAGRAGGKRGEFHGIRKLRELVLELAIRGLLVPQDPNEEAAPELLKRIRIQKSQLAKEGRGKSVKGNAQFENERPLYPVPSGWVWTTVGAIGNILGGNSISTSTKEEKYSGVAGYPFIATKDVGYGFEPLDYESGISIPHAEENFQVARMGSVLICAEGGSAGRKCGIADRDICFGNKLFANELYGGIPPNFLLAVYLSPTFYSEFRSSTTGIIGGISKAKFEKLPCPLPPLAEQRRIVAKVDELLALCDLLGMRHESSARTHEALVQAVLRALTAATDCGQSEAAWKRIQSNFDAIFTTEDSVDQLKKTILQLAVMGKLVEQDLKDEPAEALFIRLQTERQRFAVVHKFRSSPAEPVDESAVPFALPSTWKWCRLSSLLNAVTDGDHLPPPKSENGIAFLTIGNITTGQLDFEGSRFVPESYYDKLAGFRRPTRGDILYTVVGATYGRAALVETDRPFCVQRHIAILKPSRCVDAGYLMAVLRAPLTYDQATAGTTGIAQPTIPLGNLRNFLAPLPPIAEQRRIVARIDELMSLCDRLKARIQAAQTAQVRLADNFLEAAIQPASLRAPTSSVVHAP